jgi:2-methylcitrate dehydratase PrpD
MNIAASMMPVTAYEACYQGVFVRNSYAGEGARLGLTAALMAEAGFTAGENEVEEALSRVTSHIDASRIRPLEDGVYNILRYHIKLHAACGLSMGPLDAINAALGRREISPADVRRVDIVVTERTMPMGGTNPPTDLAARFSLPYEVAARLVTGASDHTAYDERYLRDPVIAQLQTRIQLHPDPDLKDGEAIARISLVDGSVLEGRCQKPRGRFDNPADRNEVLQKFESLARLSLPDEQAEALRLELEGLDRAASLAELWERVKSSTPSGASLRAASSAV